MVTLPSEAANALPHVFSLHPDDLRRNCVKILSRILRVRKDKADHLLAKVIGTGAVVRAFDGLHFNAEVVELHRHLPERSFCTIDHELKMVHLPGDVPIKCERIWRQGVDPKQIKSLSKILKVHVKDRVKPKSVEIAKSLRQEDIDALEKAYTAAYRGIEPAYQMGFGHRDAIRKVLPELLACRIKPKQFRPYVFFVFKTFQRITGQVIAPARMLASGWYINAFKNDQGIIEERDYGNAHRLLVERGYKGPTTDVPIHMLERMLAGVSVGQFVGCKPEALEAALWLYENMELVGTKETK